MGNCEEIKLLFVHTEQYVSYDKELFYSQIYQPILECNIPLKVSNFVRAHLVKPIDLDEEGRKLLIEIDNFKPHLIIYSHSWYDIPNQYLEQIKQRKIPIFTILWDTLIDSALSEINICKYSDYLAVFDSVTNYYRFKLLFEIFRDNNSGVIFTSGHHVLPQIFYYESLAKIYDVTLLGSAEGERVDLMSYLENNLSDTDIKFYKKGGLVNSNLGNHEQGLTDGWVTLDKYVKVINQSKILLCSQTRSERLQVKGKVFEFLSCQAFCLVDRNQEYELMIPKGCVAYYDSYEDLIEKIKYYHKHEEEREKIAKKGHEWYRENFKYKQWWEKFILHSCLKIGSLPTIETLETGYNKLLNDKDHIINSIMRNLRFLIQDKPPQTSISPDLSLTFKSLLKYNIKFVIKIVKKIVNKAKNILSI